MPRFHNYHKMKRERASARGRMMAKARWENYRAAIAVNPPTLSDANRVADFLRERRGQIAFTSDKVDHAKREVVTWVQRYSVKGRVDQYDLYRNGSFILTGGQKRCDREMKPPHFSILRYD